MTSTEYQKKAGAVVGSIAETLESYNNPEAQISIVKKVLWAELDRQFRGECDDEGK